MGRRLAGRRQLPDGATASASTAASLIAPAVSSSTGTVLTSSAVGIFASTAGASVAVTSARIPDVPGVMTPASSFSTSSRCARLRALPAAAPADAERHGAGDDGGRQEDRGDDATDDPPLEPGPGAVVGHLLDVDPAVVVGLDDEHAVDVERAVELGGQQVVVDRARRRRVGETRDDERVIALDRDGALGQDALVVGDGAGHRRPRRRLVAGVVPFSSGISVSFSRSREQVPASARHRSVEAWCLVAAIERQRSIHPTARPGGARHADSAMHAGARLSCERHEGCRMGIEGERTTMSRLHRLLRDADPGAVGVARRAGGAR